MANFNPSLNFTRTTSAENLRPVNTNMTGLTRAQSQGDLRANPDAPAINFERVVVAETEAAPLEEGRVKKGCKENFVNFFKKIFSCHRKKVEGEEVAEEVAQPEKKKTSLVDIFKKFFSCCKKKKVEGDIAQHFDPAIFAEEEVAQLDGARVKKGFKESFVEFFKNIFSCFNKKDKTAEDVQAEEAEETLETSADTTEETPEALAVAEDDARYAEVAALHAELGLPAPIKMD